MLRIEDREGGIRDSPNEVLAVAAEGWVLEEPRDELVVFHLHTSDISDGISQKRDKTFLGKKFRQELIGQEMFSHKLR